MSTRAFGAAETAPVIHVCVCEVTLGKMVSALTSSTPACCSPVSYLSLFSSGRGDGESSAQGPEADEGTQTRQDTVALPGRTHSSVSTVSEPLTDQNRKHAANHSYDSVQPTSQSVS